ncbi:glycosyltransferase [Candidatus Saccharibacteria bacterium]|nr:glycosyltransferase [Candidatus Saccharibacteria bacterium]
MKSSTDDALFIVMPAYNEEENIEQVVTDWMRKIEYGSKKSRLVVADSGSSDETHKILLKLQKKFNQLEILETANQYHGPKVMALYRYALKNGADFVFQTDSDGQTDPSEFEEFWEDRYKYNGIIGERKVRGDGKSRAFVEKAVCFLLRIFFGVKLNDANAPFRLMSSDLLKKYLGKLPTNYDLPNIILTAYFVRFNENIIFKEIKFAPRIAGKNSINFGKIFKIGLGSLWSFWKFRRDMNGNEPKGKFAIITLFALVAGVLVMISSAFPWNGGVEMTDSSVFLTVGRQMKEGAVPYVDSFDHKGPLMYVINFFAVMINETKGIFVFEFLAVFMTLWYMYKIFRFKNNNVWFSGLMTLILFTPFVNLYLSEGGNLTEQYAMPFITYALYVFLRYFLEGKVSSIKTFWAGIGLACVLMMRVNMAGVWLVFGLAVLIRSIYKKEFSELWRYIRWFLIGVFVVVAPIAIWLLVNGAFEAFVDTYIKFNIFYSGNETDGIISAILFFMKDITIVLGLCLSVFLVVVKKEERFMAATYLVTFIVCVLTACMSGRTYPHYGMVLVPLIVFPFATFCHDLNRGENRKPILMFLMVFLISLTFGTWLEMANREVDTLNKKLRNPEAVATTSEICKYVDKYTIASDKISVYGNWDYVYLRCNRLPASKYSYQFPIGEIDSTIMDEYFEEIKKNKPKVFVVQGIYYDETIKEFLGLHNYTEKWVEGNTGARVYVLGDLEY